MARWWLWWDGLSLLQLGSLYPQDLAQAQPPPSWSQALPSVLASRFGEQCQLRAGRGSLRQRPLSPFKALAPSWRWLEQMAPPDLKDAQVLQPHLPTASCVASAVSSAQWALLQAPGGPLPGCPGIFSDLGPPILPRTPSTRPCPVSLRFSCLSGSWPLAGHSSGLPQPSARSLIYACWRPA